MGCPGSTTHSRSFSPASRQRSAQLVPIMRLKTFEKWPECRTIRPIPSRTRRCTRSTISSFTCVVGDVPPPGEHVGAGENLLREAVLGLVERGGADLEPGSFPRPAAMAPWMPSG